MSSIDVWNEEIDRINRLHSAYGTSVEEMETVPAAQVAASFRVAFVGIRVVTANVTNGGGYDVKTSDMCQDFVVQVARTYIASLRKK